MIVFESRRQRRLLVRIERGEELLSSLAKLAEQEKIQAAWVRGIGTLGWVELDRHDQARRTKEPPQRFDTPCEIAGLEGNLGLRDGKPVAQLHVSLSRRTDNGIDLLAGTLVAAEAFDVELCLEIFEDLRLERERDARTGLSSWRGASREGAAPARERPAPSRAWTEPEAAHDEDEEEEEEEESREPSPAPSAGVSWADVAAVSAAPEVEFEPEARPAKKKAREKKAAAFEPPPLPSKGARRDEVEELFPEKGDFIQHRQFGLCRIDREDANGGLIIRLPSGVRKTIKLDFMEVGAPRMEGRKRVFPVRPRRR